MEVVKRSSFVDKVIESHPSTIRYYSEMQDSQDLVQQSLTSNSSLDEADPFMGTATAKILKMVTDAKKKESEFMEPLRAEFNAFFGGKLVDQKVREILTNNFEYSNILITKLKKRFLAI